MSTNRKVTISASAMCFDWKNVGKQLDELYANQIEYIHFDLIDGLFAPDFGMGSSIVNAILESTDFKADFHLMVENPSRIFDTLVIRPGDIVTIHQEACKNLHRDLVSLKKRGALVGVALNPGTHINSLDYVLEELDHILIMTVNPGFKGQNLVERTLPKIQDIRDSLNKLELKPNIAVDGNVNPKTIPRMVQYGANFLVGGSSGLFVNGKSITESLLEMRNSYGAF